MNHPQFQHPVFIHEEHRPMVPFVVREPIYIHPEFVSPVVEAAPVVIQPLVFPGFTPELLNTVLGKLMAEGYKVQPISATSGTFEHGNLFTHFNATYQLVDGGLQVTLTSHQDKVTQDVQTALIAARG